MKRYIIISLLLKLIVLQGISQTRYIIDNDTIIGFNKFEQREIALMLVEGDKYKELYLTDSILLLKKDTLIQTLRYTIEICDSTIQVQYTDLKLLADDNKKYQRALKRHKRGNVGLGALAGGLAITLLIILL